ncbi:hydrogenase nickel incorporation protein HypB [Aquabacterium sp. A7-Y]|uniref:hydrogenase nickel incorporation protein HypB n=1 Tax=Aquabacterium sp. A7-Y TaxID=1349605 RepID=UPI00223D7AAA|nr:hydrogenase nickel incorporation protein HypB [Aquabacterium sp. A7-Y]MCW7541120.1 hydrogenase nickel incorporation protein HypB [Aquabacterium sp. A7-Y]
MMCTICGCEAHADHEHDTLLEHGHPAGDHVHAGEDALRLDSVHAAGMDGARTVQVERDILSRNAAFAAANRRRLQAAGCLTLNLMSSPGAGKTSLLVSTVGALAGRSTVGVIEGDQQTSLDAQRIRHAGAQAVQINTGRGCHLDAHMVGHALDRIGPPQGGLLFIENVGNLVCPAAFDLGEHRKVVLLSVTEGEDKPLKYPHMFAAADLLLLTKLDLLPHVDFDMERCIAHAHRVRSGLEVLAVSVRTGAGLGDWQAWIERQRAAAVETAVLPR